MAHDPKAPACAVAKSRKYCTLPHGSKPFSLAGAMAVLLGMAFLVGGYIWLALD